jgi:hypothetical protein
MSSSPAPCQLDLDLEGNGRGATGGREKWASKAVSTGVSGEAGEPGEAALLAANEGKRFWGDAEGGAGVSWGSWETRERVKGFGVYPSQRDVHNIFDGAWSLFSGEVDQALLRSSIWASLLGRALSSFLYLFSSALQENLSKKTSVGMRNSEYSGLPNTPLQITQRAYVRYKPWHIRNLTNYNTYE